MVVNIYKDALTKQGLFKEADIPGIEVTYVLTEEGRNIAEFERIADMRTGDVLTLTSQEIDFLLRFARRGIYQDYPDLEKISEGLRAR